MRVKVNSLMAGPQGVFRPGEVGDFEPGLAAALVRDGYGEYVDAPPAPQKETPAVDNVTVTPAPPARKRR
jgi:hypothetical protein